MRRNWTNLANLGCPAPCVQVKRRKHKKYTMLKANLDISILGRYSRKFSPKCDKLAGFRILGVPKIVLQVPESKNSRKQTPPN